MSSLRVRLSGGVEVFLDDRSVVLPGHRARALVAMLALAAGRPVSVDQLVEAVWDEAPPLNPRASVHTLIARLRGIIGADRVVRSEGGYALVVARADVDLLHLQDCVDGAGPAGREAERAALRSALQLWRGEPFGVAPSGWIERQLTSPWVERHLSAFERLVDLDLEAGEVAARLPELSDLIERHPFRESLWARLLTALHREGRTAEALERYETLRTMLVEELGADPSAELQGLHRQLLAIEPLGVEAAGAESRARPCLLPRAVEDFTGREEELRELGRAVDRGVRTIAVHGPGGAGKTALVTHWARLAKERFPDGELFVDLRGYGPGEPLGALDALGLLLRGIGLPGADIPDDEAARAAVLSRELADRRMLVVLDNARAAGQVLPLLPGGESIVLVTSRSQLRGLVSRLGARRLPVDPMSTDDATALLSKRIGDAGGGPGDDLHELAELCGRLPVALVVAAERAARDSRVSVADVVARLRDEHERITTLEDWDDDPLTGVRRVFEWSYDLLEGDVARMFRLLGLLPAAQVSGTMVAALGGVTDARARRLLDRLTDWHLLRESGADRYELHDLTAAYARELVERPEGVAERDEAVRRLRSWCTHTARNARHALEPRVTEPVLDPPVEGVTPGEFSTGDGAVEWFGQYASTLSSVMTEAAREGDDLTVVSLATSQDYFLTEVVVAQAESGRVRHLALRSAERLGDPLARAICLTQVGNWLVHHGDQDRAMACLVQARDLYVEIDHSAGLLSSLINIGGILRARGEAEAAVLQFERAQEQDFPANVAGLQATLSNNLADLQLQLGRHEEAMVGARAAVVHARRAASDADLALSLITLGEVHQARGDWSSSVEALSEALASTERAASRLKQIYALALLGRAHRAMERRSDAGSAWTRALDLMDELGLEQAFDVSADDLRRQVDALA